MYAIVSNRHYSFYFLVFLILLNYFLAFLFIVSISWHIEDNLNWRCFFSLMRSCRETCSWWQIISIHIKEIVVKKYASTISSLYNIFVVI